LLYSIRVNIKITVIYSYLRHIFCRNRTSSYNSWKRQKIWPQFFDRAAHFMARNLNLKMGFFQTKNRRHWTTRWDNPTKISWNIDLLEIYQMLYLNFYLKFFLMYFWENSVFRVCWHGPTSAVVARKQRPIKIRNSGSVFIKRLIVKLKKYTKKFSSVKTA
jgi:hypothetical protein